MKILRSSFGRKQLRHPAVGAVASCLRTGCRWVWYAGAAVLVVVAVAATVLRLWLPTLSGKKPEIEAYLSEKASRPVHIERMEAYWKGLHPRLRVQGLSLRSGDGTVSVLQLSEVRLRVAWFPLLVGNLVFDELTLVRPVVRATRLKDGRFTIADIMTTADTQATDNGALLQWLFRQNRIRIEDGEFHWLDLKAMEPPVRISRINLNLENSGDRHRFAGSLGLPERISRDIKIVLDLEGNPLTEPDWTGKLYLHAVELDIGELPRILRERLPEGLRGQVNTQVWTEWEQDRLRSADGFVGLTAVNLRLPGLKRPLEIKNLEGELSWKHEKEDWSLHSKNLKLWLYDKPWSFGEVRARADSERHQTNITVDRVRIDQLMPLVNELESQAKSVQIIRQLQPTGEVRDLRLVLHGSWQQPLAFTINAELVNTSVLPYRKFPGVTGLNGQLLLTKTGGKLSLKTEGATVDFPHLFSGPLPVDYASGIVTWWKKDDHWRVIGEQLRMGNEDGRGTGELEVSVPFDRSQSPFLKLRADFSDGNGHHAARYYPVKKLSKKVTRWLRRAIISGLITGGSLNYEGKIREFPFTEGDGRFEMVAHVSNAIVDYAPGWPRVENGEADLFFNKAEMLITGGKGRLHGLNVDQLRVHIQNLRDPKRIVMVDGDLRGPFHEVVNFLQDGPLFKNNQLAALGMSGSGDGVLGLSVAIPLKSPKTTKVTGRYRFLGSKLRFATGIVLSGIEGVLDFTETELKSGPIRARILGGEAVLEVSTPAPGRNPTVIVKGTGQAQAKALNVILPAGVVAPLGGDADWSGRLRVGGGTADLHVESDLVGVSSRFPAPLAKRGKTPMKLALDSRYRGADGKTIVFTVGKQVNGRLFYGQGDGENNLDRGQIVMGEGAAELPAKPGILFTVRASRLDADKWIDHFKAPSMGGEGPDESLARITGEVDALKLFGRVFNNVGIDVTKQIDQRWQGAISGDEGNGRLKFSWGKTIDDIALDLERLVWPGDLGQGAGQSTAKSSNPAEFPHLQVSSRTFQYGSLQLGELQLEMEPVSGGCKIKRLHLRKPDMELIASGTWLNLGDRQESRYDVRFSSTDLAKTLTGLGLAGHVEGGSAEIEGWLSWTGGPEALALAGLRADLEISARRGRFLNVDPGAGRLFGLFNVEALTRRLTLDFSDIFSKGFAFDKIKGSLAVRDGSAYTRDLSLKGPAANIEVKGRSGVVTEDYDLALVVMPQVGGALPLAGWLAGSPAAGVAIYAMQKLFKKQLAGIIKYNYVVTGPWNEPVIVKTEPGTKEG